MDFVDAYSFPLKMWHAFGLSTFRINLIPSACLSRFRKVYTVICTLLSIAFFCVHLHFFKLPKARMMTFGRLLFGIADKFFYLLLPSIGLVICVESLIKESDQRSFLNKMMSIDKEFGQRLKINVEYSSQKHRSKQRFIWWMTITLAADLALPLLLLWLLPSPQGLLVFLWFLIQNLSHFFYTITILSICYIRRYGQLALFAQQ